MIRSIELRGANDEQYFLTLKPQKGLAFKGPWELAFGTTSQQLKSVPVLYLRDTCGVLMNYTNYVQEIVDGSVGDNVRCLEFANLIAMMVRGAA